MLFFNLPLKVRTLTLSLSHTYTKIKVDFSLSPSNTSILKTLFLKASSSFSDNKNKTTNSLIVGVIKWRLLYQDIKLQS